MSSSIRCLAIPANKQPFLVDIEENNILDILQKMVGGNIEGYPLRSPEYETGELCLYVNENGLNLGLPRNINIPSAVGDMVLCLLNEDGEEIGFSSSLSCAKIMSMLKKAM